MNTLTSYEALLVYKWILLPNNTIEGAWAEDGSTFIIQCPYQLAPLLVQLQNALHLRYTQYKNLNKKISEIQKIFEELE